MYIKSRQHRQRLRKRFAILRNEKEDFFSKLVPAFISMREETAFLILDNVRKAGF